MCLEALDTTRGLRTHREYVRGGRAWGNFIIDEKGADVLQSRNLPLDVEGDMAYAIASINCLYRKAKGTHKAMAAFWSVVLQPVSPPVKCGSHRVHSTVPYAHHAYTFEQIRAPLHIPDGTSTWVCMDVRNRRSLAPGVLWASFACCD